jgi:hypothetical protein
MMSTRLSTKIQVMSQSDGDGTEMVRTYAPRLRNFRGNFRTRTSIFYPSRRRSPWSDAIPVIILLGLHRRQDGGTSLLYGTKASASIR